MTGILALFYGLCAYLIFFGSFHYAIGFVGNVIVPKTIDTGVAGPPLVAAAVNAALLTLFAAQHSIMARPAFKRWWTRLVPKSVERSTYVLLASLCLILLIWQWRPIPATVWAVTDPVASMAIEAVFWTGWGILLVSTFLISHFELFGLAQVLARLRRRELAPPEFRTPVFYKLVRHPIYLGFLLAFWAAPTMSVGHLLFSTATTLYILLGIFLEERDLVTLFGDRYRQYRREVGMLIPRLGRRSKGVPSPQGHDVKAADLQQ